MIISKTFLDHHIFYFGNMVFSSFSSSRNAFLSEGDKLAINSFVKASTMVSSIFKAIFSAPSSETGLNEDATIEDLKTKLDEKWNELLQKDLVKINEFFKKEWKIE